MEPLGVRRQRGLSRLRRRVFFHGEDGSSSDPQRRHRRRILERITLRRRKAGEGDAFWTAILVSTLLFFALMCYMSVYLTQTDVFAAHQGDLFGTTVDNRFTVVSQENERAVITLKSGYSNSRFSEAMVAFSEGELHLGRRALAPTDTQSFYGLSVFNNGSAAFTNRLSAPLVKTEYVHASKAIVFEDGTVMTTAANISGGVKEVGDLNVVSQTGSVSLSAGGKPVVVVSPKGTVSLQRTGADRPGAMGITLDGAAGRLSIGESFWIESDVGEQSRASLTATTGLYLNTTHVFIGSSLSTVAVFTCPKWNQSDDDSDNVVDEMITMAIEGQLRTGDAKAHGGDVLVQGGDGVAGGGQVVIQGGKVESGNHYGDVKINSGLPPVNATSLTEIGSTGASHQVRLQGSIGINVPSNESGKGSGLAVGGTNVTVRSTTVEITNSEFNESFVSILSRRVSLTTTDGKHDKLASTIKLGRSGINVHANGVLNIDASRAVMIGSSNVNTSTTIVGDVVFRDSEDTDDDIPNLALSSGRLMVDAIDVDMGGANTTERIKLVSPSVVIGDSSHLFAASNESNAGVIISGHNVMVGSDGASIRVNGGNVRLKAKKTSAGADDGDEMIELSGLNRTMVLQGRSISIGTSHSDGIVIGGESVKTIAITSEKLDVGSSTKELKIGGKKTAIQLGSKDGTVDIVGKVTMNGEALHTSRLLSSRDERRFDSLQTSAAIFALTFDSQKATIRVPLRAHLDSHHPSLLEEFSEEYQLKWRITGNQLKTHATIALSMDNARVRFDQLSEQLPSQPWKMRCV
ncbi:hypothetical protein PINS_up019336 [Pythium insidiosum]|nr:hypothetical protein PINS_up019336 [Pythium insidiosum]